ncbi:hypothetical protein [Agrobacterium rubi]|uniref:Uncharacterized protein n=1 Tax=Agrobacterium rubi TaxID=28099 RepID=A0AAE7UR66_9HYPH|nr:hypothetical protein [Agrobacterium rubi]NTE85773.1 hypothetical protein [Agrobacterium rubi]NTF01705.1 hypothetical protein [Agrobacterium rubi]NTF35948.1 hypothetical protein [Agrobacterium rubi]OCJ53237.1 hypothetical protein A6U92_25105 [Agrobacterium rubi]QTG01047.1 hypothetical protein G6M88_11890 [Agrobacterium rubi]
MDERDRRKSAAILEDEIELKQLLLARIRGKFVSNEEGRSRAEGIIEAKKVFYGLAKSAPLKD